MILKQTSFRISTRGRGTYEITSQVSEFVRQSGIADGICNIFLHHTSASLILCENYEPDVRRDLEVFFAALVPDGDKRFVHRDEGPDDMPAHIRTALTTTSLGLSFDQGRLVLGTWQAVYLWEHRARGQRRQLSLHLLGE